MMTIKVTHGFNSEREKLIHAEAKGLVSAPYPKSFEYGEGVLSWRDLLGVDPVVRFPKAANSFVQKGTAIVCVIGFVGGYAKLTLENGNCISTEWITTHREGDKDDS